MLVDGLTDAGVVGFKDYECVRFNFTPEVRDEKSIRNSNGVIFGGCGNFNRRLF